MFRSEPLAPGDRVVVRRRAGSHLTDVIGHIVALEPLTIRPQKVGGLPSDAAELVIPDADIQVVRRLSPRRIRNSDIRAVETAYARAFPGQERMLIDGWLARAGSSIAERSNSATPLGHSAGFGPVPLEKLRAFYTERGMPVQLLIPERIGAPAMKLVGHTPGWELGPEIVVMTRQLSGAGASDGAGLESRFEFRVDDYPDDDWLSMYHFRGQSLPPEALRELAHEIEGTLGFGRLVAVGAGGAAAAAVGARGAAAVGAGAKGGETVAVTRGTITNSDDGRVWLGYSAVEVAAEYRRQGLATQLGLHMLEWGASNGATDAYLQVLSTNDAGIGLYTKLGFVEHHRHRYAVARDVDKQVL